MKFVFISINYVSCACNNIMDKYDKKKVQKGLGVRVNDKNFI